MFLKLHRGGGEQKALHFTLPQPPHLSLPDMLRTVFSVYTNSLKTLCSRLAYTTDSAQVEPPMQIVSTRDLSTA